MSTCAWPNHDDPSCHECAVLDRCLAQTRAFEDPHTPGWWHGIPGDRSGWSTRDPNYAARRVCARLIAWVRWPGVTRLRLAYDARTAQAEREGCGVIADMAASELAALIRADGLEPREQIHPLDGTPVAGLLPAGTLWGRSILEGETVGIEGPTTWETDWPALAKIAAYLDLSGTLYELTKVVLRRIGDNGEPTESHMLVVADDILQAGGIRLGDDLDAPLWIPPASMTPWLDEPGLWAEVHAWREPQQFEVLPATPVSEQDRAWLDNLLSRSVQDMGISPRYLNGFLLDD